jgi:phenylalanyl-tRNA synthetase beta chain
MELVDVEWSARELASRLTLCGTAAQATQFLENHFENIVIGRILELERIEGTEHLSRAVVATGGESFQVVCGAPNAAAGQTVVLAKIGSKLKGFGELKKAKLRGVESFGMICSEAELGITDDHSGILVLDENIEIGTPAERGLGLDDPILKFDLTPNRPDSLSAIGVARDAACLANKKIQRPVFELKEAEERAADFVKVAIDDAQACPRYAARVIKGVRVGPSPWRIKRKLILSGMRPINNVVDITNLVMLEMGHPLHAFDYRRFNRKEILVRRARAGEKFSTLDGKAHVLTPDTLLITDGEVAVAAAGVMGGLDSEVSQNTADILLESAYFNPIAIRKSRLKLGIVSESSVRFEKGADPNAVAEAIDRAAFLIQKYAGGKVLKGIVDCYPAKVNPIKINLRPSRANAILGSNISKERMSDILTNLEFQVTDKNWLEVTVPTFRPDITREIDLIEEIARIEGYENIPTADRNIGPLYTPINPDDRLRQQIRTGMTALGFDEIYGSNFADPKLMSALESKLKPVAVLNPIAEDLSVLQNNTLYSALMAVGHNLAQRNLDLRLFEIAKKFIASERRGESPLEIEELVMAVTGRSGDAWYERGREYDFFDVKGATIGLIDYLRAPRLKLEGDRHPCFEADMSFCLKCGDSKVGYAGRINQKLARSFDIKQPVYVAQLDFNFLLNNQSGEGSYSALPRFPSAIRDLAIIVDEKFRVGDIMDAIREAGRENLESVDLFDLFRGKQIGEGKKSLAFSMVFRSRERSLDSKEVDNYQGIIIENLKKRFNIEVREG